MTRAVVTGIRPLMQIVLAVFVLFGTSALGQVPSRIIAVGDVHGDVDMLASILKEASIIDETRHWSGGDATLVQVGDMLDRGLKDPDVLDLYMTLEEEAAAAGGQVIVLLGNHEVMNLMGDLRYVTNYSPFAASDADERRQASYQAYTAWKEQRAEAHGKPAPSFSAEDEKKWMQDHYRGYVEREEAFAPDGKYGAWLRTRKAIARVGDYIFLHGGISPAMSKHSIEELNQKVTDDISRFDDIKKTLLDSGVFVRALMLDEMVAAAGEERAALHGISNLTDEEQARLEAVKALQGHPQWTSWHPDGPLWFRGYGEWKDGTGSEHIATLRKAYGENVRFVVGHSVMKNKKIHNRFDNAVFLIDTGMSAMYYRGKPSALEIVDGGVAAVYRRSRHTFIKPTVKEPQVATAPAVANPRIWWGANGQPLPFSTDAEVMEFMRTAEVISMKDIGEGVTKPKKVLLEKEGIQMHAIFRDVSKVYQGGDIALQQARDDNIFECAAYALSGILGINNIPPVVIRKVKGKTGTAQIWIEHAMTEGDRRKKKVAPFDPVRWAQDWQMVEMFDNLIYNDDRNSGNIIIDQTFNVWMIDHTRAFREYSDLRESPEKYLKQVERGVWNRLRTLDDEAIERVLDPFLQVYEIEGLLKRRQKLVAFIQGLIDKNGEDAVLFSW
ncbi:uncharacterized protein METZ01_LOCUS167336 [marine metagenome]|uniref:Calcineurin-like phosphoesterase domain-containing protein n=1 Tax=marine metagenome TaxID=408172 RepID=A0A382BME2_9ZZZZ